MYSAPAGKARLTGIAATFLRPAETKVPAKAWYRPLRINPEQCEDERGKAIDLVPVDLIFRNKGGFP